MTDSDTPDQRPTDSPYPDGNGTEPAVTAPAGRRDSPYPDGGGAAAGAVDDPWFEPRRRPDPDAGSSVFAPAQVDEPAASSAETKPPRSPRRPWRWAEPRSGEWGDYDDADFDEDPQDWQDLPRRSSFLFRLVVSLLVVAIGVLTIGTFAVGWLNDQLDPPGDPGDELVIEIPVGASTNDIARILDDSGVVTRSWVFRYYLRWKDAPEFQAGVYTFKEDMAVWEAREVLEGGPAPADLSFVTVVEGLRVEQVIASLLDQLPDFDRGELEAALADPANRPALVPPGAGTLEGVLFPATYDVPDALAADEAGLVARMVSQFDVEAADLDIEARAAALDVTPYEAVIVASLIEEEAAYAPDRSKIARVIYNRLAIDEPLGIDATVLYAVGKAPGDTIFQSDLDFDSPYNTRLNPGLPPTPIASPGRDSLEAALNPAEGPWLFYALTNEGGNVGAHRFSETLAEHNEAVAECRALDLGC